VVSFLLEPFEPLRDLLAPCRQVWQRKNLLLIDINKTLQLPLHMLFLYVDTVQLRLELLLLPLLDVLPQRLFLANHLRVLEQLTDQAPYHSI
jgi:hypothetical protein